MDPHRSKAVGFWNASAAGNATKAGVAGRKHTVTYFAYSSDAAATVTLESPAGTILWRKTFGAAFSGSETLPPGEYECPVGQDVVVNISAGTTKNADLAGYDITG